MQSSTESSSNAFFFILRSMGIIFLSIGVGLLAWGSVRLQSLFPHPATALRIGICNRPAYASVIDLNKGLKTNAQSPFRGEVEFVILTDEDNPVEMLRKGSVENGVDMLWATADSFPKVLERCPEAKVIMKVGSSTGLDAIVPAESGEMDLNQNDHVYIPEYGPGHWLVHKQLVESNQSCRTYLRYTRQYATAFDELQKHSVKCALLSGLELQTWKESHPQTTTSIDEVVELLVAKDSFVQTHRKQLAHLVKTWLSNSRPPDDIARVIHNTPPFVSTQTELSSLLGKVTPSSIEDNQKYFCPSWEGFDSRDVNLTPFKNDIGSYLKLMKDFPGDHRQFISHAKNAEQSINTSSLDDAWRDSPNNTFGQSYLCAPIASVHFAFGSATADDMSNLESQLKRLDDITKAKFTITAFADHDGEVKSNKELSEKRASSLRDYLISRNVPPENIKARGSGLYGNDKDSMKQKESDRHADIYVFQ